MMTIKAGIAFWHDPFARVRKKEAPVEPPHDRK